MSLARSADINYAISLLPPLDGLRVLDLGCGTGYWGWIIKVCMDQDPYLVGVEIDDARAEKVRNTMGVYNKIRQFDVRNISKWIDDEKYDVVIMSHVIEHMIKEDGLSMILDLKRITRDLLLMPYPEGDWLYRGHDCDGKEFHDCHNSIWTEADFRALGFETKFFRLSAKAGRVVGWFEGAYFALKGIGRKGYSVAWWQR